MTSYYALSTQGTHGRNASRGFCRNAGGFVVFVRICVLFRGLYRDDLIIRWVKREIIKVFGSLLLYFVYLYQ